MSEAEARPGHAFAETRNLHADDAYLRRHGFTIYARPKGCPPIWRRNGRVFSQMTALGFAAEEDRAALEA